MNKPQQEYFHFNKDYTVTVGIPRYEYERIESLSMKTYTDIRRVRSVLKCYAVVSLFSRLSGTSEFVPIHSGIFKSNSSGSRYAEYQNLLKLNGLIEVRDEIIDSYTDEKGLEHIFTVTPKSFRLYHNTNIAWPEKLSPEQNKLWFLILAVPDKETFVSLQQKYRAIQSYSCRPDKVGSTFSVNNGECYTVKLFVEFIKKIVNGKINSPITFKRHIRDLYSRSREHESFKFNSASDIMLLIFNILDNIHEIREREKETEQIGGTDILEHIKNQCHIARSVKSGGGSEFSYYAGLSIDLAGLDLCIRTKDLYDIAGLDRIPHIGKAGKIYSVFSRIRRPIRKFIRFNGEHLIEASDIHCAHYTMLPMVFRYCNISVPKDEMERFVALTQTNDLYGEVVADTGISRDTIKPVFQSFYSIKDESQYLYAGRKKGEYRQRELICRFFRSNFPGIYGQMLHFHKSHGYTLKSVANLAESNIMNPICRKLMSFGLHPFRLHDAIYLTKTEFEASKSLIDIDKEVYEKINENFSKLF